MFQRRKLNKNGFFLLIPVLAYLCVWGYQQYSIHHRLDTQGVATTGYVVSVEDKYLKGGAISKRIHYRFVVDGTTYFDTATAHTNQTSVLTERQPVEIRYVPADPSISEIVDNDSHLDLSIVLFFGLICGVALLIGLTVMAVSTILRRSVYR